MMAKLVSALTFLSLLATKGVHSFDVTVEFSPETVSGPETEVEMKCKYSGIGSSASVVDWRYNGIDGSAAPHQIINLVPDNSTGTNVAKPGYEEKLIEASEIGDEEQAITLRVDWCSDLGMYDCYVQASDSETRSETGEAELKASPEESKGKLMLNGNPFEEDTRVNTPTGTVECVGMWLTEEVSAELSDGTNDATSDAATAGAECGYEATASLDYTFNAAGENLEFTCVTVVNGTTSEPVAHTVYFQADPPTTTTMAVEGSAVFYPVSTFLLVLALLAYSALR